MIVTALPQQLIVLRSVYFTCHFVAADSEFCGTAGRQEAEEKGKLEPGSEQTPLVWDSKH